MPAGRPTKYDPDFHPADCIRLGREGYFKVEMADEWDVCCDTINIWCKEHPEFFSAYKKACSYRSSWLLKAGKSGLFGSKESQMNALAWSMMMRYDGQNTDERTVYLPEIADCKTFSEKSECIINAFGAGRLTPKEANTLADLVMKGAKVEEVTDLRKKLEEIEAVVKAGGHAG